MKQNTSPKPDAVEGRETRPPVTMHNNAIYTGEWLGKDRDGTGY